MSKALLIMAHGSRSETANDEFRVLVNTVAESGPGAGQEYVAVLPCFLELANPSLIEAIQQLEHQPVKTVQLYPLFFNKGKHVGRDIPAQVEDARQRFPDLSIELLEYFGSARGLTSLILQHVSEQA